MNFNASAPRTAHLPENVHRHGSRLFRDRLVLAAAISISTVTTATAASTCPFDTGGSDAVNDGVVLTRYALGITGSPLVASTKYASLDPLQVKANIECVGCALDINGDGVVDTVDTTIIARHLSGFTGGVADGRPSAREHRHHRVRGELPRQRLRGGWCDQRLRARRQHLCARGNPAPAP